MRPITPVLPGHAYHIFNRGNNDEDIFRDESCYRRFMRLYAHHVAPIAETYAFCFLRNHFHLLVRFHERSQLDPAYARTTDPAQALSNLFNAYTQGTNIQCKRSGKLFREPFRRIAVGSESYFANLIVYIHRNPQKHGFVKDFRDWPWSSYHALICNQPTELQRTTIYGVFGGAKAFRELHRRDGDEASVQAMIQDDFM